MGAVEEGGKVAGGVVDALKSQPLSLALVVMNIALLILFWRFAENIKFVRLQEFEHQKQVETLLANCISSDYLRKFLPTQP